MWNQLSRIINNSNNSDDVKQEAKVHQKQLGTDEHDKEEVRKFIRKHSTSFFYW